MAQVIHRAGMGTKMVCGATSGRFSMSGVRASITCPACLKLQGAPPVRITQAHATRKEQGR